MDQNYYYLQLQFCGKKKVLSLIFVGIGTCWAPGSQTCKTVMDNGHAINQLNTLLPAAAGQDMHFCLVALLGKIECHFTSVLVFFGGGLFAFHTLRPFRDHSLRQL